jgi:hypothetical protein
MDFFAYKATAFNIFDTSWTPGPKVEETVLVFASKASAAAGLIVISALILAYFKLNSHKKLNKVSDSSSDSKLPSTIDYNRVYNRNLLTVFKKYHKYLNILTSRVSSQRDVPNHIKIVIMSLFLSSALFTQCILFNKLHSDNISCFNFNDESSCNSYFSYYSFGEATCIWDSINLSCSPGYKQDIIPSKHIFYIVVISSFFTQIISSILLYFSCTFINSNKKVSFGDLIPISQGLKQEDKKKIAPIDTSDNFEMILPPVNPVETKITGRVSPKSNNFVLTFDNESDENISSLDKVKYINTIILIF